MIKNNKISYIIVMIGSIICLCACGSEKNGTLNIVETSTVPELNIEDEIISNIIGTYVGEQGSGITLYGDGKAAYYFNRNIDRNDSWVYENGAITIYLTDLGYDIYANVKNGNTSSLVFKSDDIGWIEEPFIKVSSEQEKLSPDDYDTFLKSMYGLEDDVTYTPISVGGIDFLISSDYMEDDSDSTDVKQYSHKSISAGMQISNIDTELSSEEFLKHLDEYGLDLLDENRSLTIKNIIQVAGLEAGEHIFLDDSSYSNQTVCVVHINNVEKGNIVRIIYVYDTNYDEKYSCEIDYKNLIETAVISDREEKSDSLNETITSDIENSSVREFLDSYEAFINEYVDFIKEYYISDNVLGMLSEYADMMIKYAEFTEKVEALDEDAMSSEDAAYYVEVLARCNKKISEIYQLIQ